MGRGGVAASEDSLKKGALASDYFPLPLFFFLKMNDFGIKNMDQVAPVSNSYRGTLKVSEQVLLKVGGFLFFFNLESSISRRKKQKTMGGVPEDPF